MSSPCTSRLEEKGRLNPEKKKKCRENDVSYLWRYTLEVAPGHRHSTMGWNGQVNRKQGDGEKDIHLLCEG